MSGKALPRPNGFTLIEVLIALAIIAFGLIAVFGQLNQSALAASRLRDKTIAHWIAMNLLTERRLSRQFPGTGKESDEIEMANTRWRYEISFSETALESMRRADVSVFFADDPARPVATASGFLMEVAAGAGIARAGTGWPTPGQQGSPLDGSSLAPEPPPAPVTSPEEARK